MPSHHSWHEIKTVLLALGYRQHATGDDRIIYKNGEDNIVIQKSNKLDVTYVLIVCQLLDIKYIDFLRICEREYARIAKQREVSKIQPRRS
jgi:hypothetical protein